MADEELQDEQILDEAAQPDEPSQTPEELQSQMTELNTTWEGRLRKKDQAIDRLDTQLAQYNLRVDRETGELVSRAAPPAYNQYSPAGYQQSYAPAAQEEFDPFDEAQVQQRIEAGVQRGITQFAQSVMPLLDTLTTTTVANRHDDWNEIGSDVTSRLRDTYGVTLAQAQAQAPQLLDDLILAARARRAATSAGGQPTPPGTGAPGAITAEALRRAAVAQATGVGATEASGGANDYGLTADEIAEIHAAGMTVEEFVKLGSGPAKVGGL